MASFKAALQSHINSANSIIDLVSLLQQIPSTLHAIKMIANEQIKLLNHESLRKTYYNSVSMNDILSDDVTQHILSFASFHQTHTVCKEWETHSDKNERNYLTKLHKSLNATKNQTIIVDQKRPKLHETEIKLGFIGPYSDLSEACVVSGKGDRILVKNGNYPISKHGMVGDIEMIGIENNVVLNIQTRDENDGLNVYGTLHIQNVTIVGDSSQLTGTLQVAPNSKVSMKDCIIQSCFIGIMVRNGSDLNVEGCTFVGNRNGIEMSPLAASVTVSNCLFTESGKDENDGCVLVYDDFNDAPYPRMPNLKCVHLQCIGNIFENNHCCPIIEQSDKEQGYFIFGTEKYVLRDNVLKGFNRTSDIHINDANKLYHSESLSI